MSLPKVQVPTFTLKLPSDGTKITYRPFQVREEKILLIAQQSEDTQDQLRAVKQIVQNCILEPENINVNELASFDIEYLFLKLRAKSVGENVTVQISPRKRDDLPPQKVEIDIDKIEPTYDENHKSLIDIGGGLSIQMQYPTFEMISNISDTEDSTEVYNLFQKTMSAIYEGDTVYETKDFSDQEVNEFLESLSSQQLLQIQEFFTTLPKLRKTVKYKWTNPEDSTDTYEEDIVLEGLLNFLS